jgi:hypothetical protein
MTSAHCQSSFLAHSAFQLVLEHEGQEAAEEVAADGFIAFMKDGTGFQDAFGRGKGVLNHPDRLVNMRHSLRIVIGVAAQDKNPIIMLIGGHELFINHKAARTFQFKEATITLVAEKALGSAPKLLGQGGKDSLAVAGVFATLFLIEADNVTTILDF